MNATVITTGPGVIIATGDRVEELLLGEPVALDHHAAVQERHDGEAAAEHDEPRGEDRRCRAPATTRRPSQTR